jgi:elongation factor 1-beta
MANVVASFKILPQDTDIKLEDLKVAINEQLPKEVKVYKFAEEPIAFGLNALLVHIIMPEDIPGEMDKVEESIKNIKGVGQIEVLMVHRT